MAIIENHRRVRRPRHRAGARPAPPAHRPAAGHPQGRFPVAQLPTV